MLVVRRSEGDTIVLVLPNKEEITITVLRNTPSAVRLGFEAPVDIKIIRGEMYSFLEGVR